MKKTIAFILSGLMMVSTSALSTAYATETEEANTPSNSEIINELKNYESPYYMESFDFNKDGNVDSFDMVTLRKLLVTGESGVTVSTAVKFERWLLGIDDSLGTVYYSYDSHNPSMFKADYIKNLMSNDFRFVGCNESILYRLNGDTSYEVSYGVEMCFLGVDEYVAEHIFIYNFCNSSDEFDEFVAEREGFSIGIKDNAYALALNGSKESENPTSEETASIGKIGSAFCHYNLTQPNLSNDEVLQMIEAISNSLTAEQYSFTIEKEEGSDKAQLLGKTELSEVSIKVYEFEPVRETPILETDDFYLFYDNTKGFGLTEK